MPVEDKMTILEKLEEGVSNTDVGRFFGMNESTLFPCTVEKNEKAIMECLACLLRRAVRCP